MIQPETLKFLTGLRHNNNKAWFEENRHRYEAAKDNLQELVAKLIPEIARFDEPIGNLAVKDCTFRINRDIRFSKDKTPYKTNLAAYFSRGGKKAIVAGYYFHCEPGQSYAAGGFYSPPPPQLLKLRQEIDYNFDEWKKIINAKAFRKCFADGVEGIEVLTRPPKGYEDNNPAIEFLKMKHFIVKRPFSDVALQSKTLAKDLAKVYSTMYPMINFLNKAVE